MYLYSVIVLHKKENLFHKLIGVIQIFMRKFFVAQYYPQKIFNFELFLNYCVCCVCVVCVCVCVSVCVCACVRVCVCVCVCVLLYFIMFNL